MKDDVKRITTPATLGENICKTHLIKECEIQTLSELNSKKTNNSI